MKKLYKKFRQLVEKNDLFGFYQEGDEVDIIINEIEEIFTKNVHSIVIYKNEVMSEVWDDLVERFPDMIEEDKATIYTIKF